MTIEELRNVDLRIGRVVSAERVEGSEKLLKLEVDLGAQTRQILSGIAKWYPPETLVGRDIVIVANLEPRSMMGLESQGMVLAATNAAGEAVLLVPEGPIEPGSAVH